MRKGAVKGNEKIKGWGREGEIKGDEREEKVGQKS